MKRTLIEDWAGQTSADRKLGIDHVRRWVGEICSQEFQSRPSLACFAFGSDVGPGKCCVACPDVADFAWIAWTLFCECSGR